MLERRKIITRFLSILGLGVMGFGGGARARLSPEDVVRAWEDPSYRNSLSEAQWDALPPNPAGETKSGEFKGDLANSGNNCSGNNCSGNNCSGNNCSGNNCSGDNCSGNNCSGDNCSGNNCSGNNC
jgi:mersacidin/lichenicidin family type 2 lantibiotic